MTNNNIVKAKGAFAVVAAVISYLTNCFSEIIVVLCILMVIDYVLGIMAAIVKRVPLSIQKGFGGLLKKSGYIACLGVAFLADYVVYWTSGILEIPINTGGSLGIVTCLYLMGTEGISIFSHLTTLGIPVPKALQNVFDKLREE